MLEDNRTPHTVITNATSMMYGTTAQVPPNQPLTTAAFSIFIKLWELHIFTRMIYCYYYYYYLLILSVFSFRVLSVSTSSVETFEANLSPCYTWSEHALPVTDVYCGCGGMRSHVVTSSLDQTCKVCSV